MEDLISLYQAIDELLYACQLWEIRVERDSDITPETLIYIDICEEDDEETFSLITSEELNSNFRNYFRKRLDKLNEEFEDLLALGVVDEDNEDDFLAFTPSPDEYKNWKLQVINYLAHKLVFRENK
jgi:hypothetical protein